MKKKLNTKCIRMTRGERKELQELYVRVLASTEIQKRDLAGKKYFKFLLDIMSKQDKRYPKKEDNYTKARGYVWFVEDGAKLCTVLTGTYFSLTKAIILITKYTFSLVKVVELIEE